MLLIEQCFSVGRLSMLVFGLRGLMDGPIRKKD